MSKPHITVSVQPTLALADLVDPVAIEELLGYARNVSSTTSAPADWNPSKPLKLFRPPNPQEDMMRSSLLYKSMEPTDHPEKGMHEETLETRATASAKAPEKEKPKSKHPSPPGKTKPVEKGDSDTEMDDIFDLDLNPDLK